MSKTAHRMKKPAIAYIRFSSDEQADGNSIERQEGNIKRYAESLDLSLVETLIDGLLVSPGSTGRTHTHYDVLAFPLRMTEGKLCATVRHRANIDLYNAERSEVSRAWPLNQEYTVSSLNPIRLASSPAVSSSAG